MVHEWKSSLDTQGHFADIQSPEELMALKDDPHKTPILVRGDALRFGAGSVATIVRNDLKIDRPLIYFTAKRDLSPRERMAFLDAGGDSLLDQSDIGEHEQDNNVPLLVRRKVEALTRRNRLAYKVKLEPLPGFMVDLPNMRVRIEGVVVNLTALEFNILKSLAEHGGTARHKHIWEEIFDGRERLNVLRVKINQINAKILPFKVSSVRGFGYRLTKKQRVE